MTAWARLPIRVRLTATFAAGLLVALAVLSGFVYTRTGTALLVTDDAGLRSRAEVVAANVRAGNLSLSNADARLIESDEAFTQIVDATGRVLHTTPATVHGSALSPEALRSIRGPKLFEARVAGIDGTARVLVAPVGSAQGTFLVVVGTSLQDRSDTLGGLAAALAFGGIAALVVLSLIAWFVIGAALRPVDRMRHQAAAISAASASSRLSVPPGRDEIASLAATLNEMLDRIEAAVESERRLVDRASHELRTPLAVQRMDLDLALSGPQTIEELQDALRSVSEENEHLIGVAEDLLLLARSRGGELGVRREETSLAGLTEETAGRFADRAAEAGIRLETRAPDERAWLDARWMRQALDNLVENALRHTPSGGTIDVSAERRNAVVAFMVQDTGSGFPDEVLRQAFEPFSHSADGAREESHGAGLGLSLVRAVATAHGGRAWAENRPEGGARVMLEMPDLPVRPGYLPTRTG